MTICAEDAAGLGGVWVLPLAAGAEAEAQNLRRSRGSLGSLNQASVEWCNLAARLMQINAVFRHGVPASLEEVAHATRQPHRLGQ